MGRFSFNKNALWIIPLLFLLFSAPASLDYLFHFPDEKYYTDAVLQMMEKSDYLTPYKADGTPRFLKPIITYWVLIASYKIFGISPFSSRVLFWIAGSILVFITWLMAKSVSQNHKVAAFAAAITAANPLVLLSAGRSIPDILLVLFLTISAWGFLEIMLRENPDKKWYWIAYLGAALAFQTKGLPAVAFAGISILYVCFNPWKRKKFKLLIEPFSIFISVCVALSWFIAMYFKHGPEYFTSFFDDQVGERVSSGFELVMKNFLLGLLNLIAFLIPWIIIAFSKPVKLKVFLKNLKPEIKAISGFILSWIILVLIMAGAVHKFYDRYLLPVIPLISLLFAIVFCYTETGFKKATKVFFTLLNLLFLCLLVWYLFFISFEMAHVFGLLVSGIFIILLITGVFRNLNDIIHISGLILFLFFNAFIFLNPVLMPNPGKQIVEQLQKECISKKDSVHVFGNIRMASNLRIQSRNSICVISRDTSYSLPVNENHFLVFDQRDIKRLNLIEYDVFPGSEELQNIKAEDFPEFMQHQLLRIKAAGIKYYIAKPKSSR